MIRFAAFCAVLFAFILNAQPVAAAPMFVNGGFETGDFTGWTVSGNAEHGVATGGTPINGTLIAGNLVNSRTGDFAAFGKFQGGVSPARILLEQTVELEPDVTYAVTLRRGVFGDGTDYRWSNYLKMWVNNGSVATSSGGFHIGPMWSTTTIGNYHFPAGQTSVTFHFEFGGYELNSQGLAGFSIDDISIQQVPEPTSMCWLALAAVVVGTRRCRLSAR